PARVSAFLAGARALTAHDKNHLVRDADARSAADEAQIAARARWVADVEPALIDGADASVDVAGTAALAVLQAEFRLKDADLAMRMLIAVDGRVQKGRHARGVHAGSLHMLDLAEAIDAPQAGAADVAIEGEARLAERVQE